LISHIGELEQRIVANAENDGNCFYAEYFFHNSLKIKTIFLQQKRPKNNNFFVCAGAHPQNIEIHSIA